MEGHRLVTGSGAHGADWNAPGQRYGSFVRSDHARAQIVSVNTAKAMAHPGVKGVYTGEDAVREGCVRAAHALKSTESTERLVNVSAGYFVVNKPEEYAAMIQTERAKWATVIRQTGVKLVP